MNERNDVGEITPDPERGLRAPVRWLIDPGIGVVRMTFRGPFSFDAWRDAIESLLASPEYEVGMGFLLDRRDADPPATSDVVAMIQFLDARRERVEGSRWAFLTADVADYGMVRMTENLAFDQPTELESFADEADALGWLTRGGSAGRQTG